MAGRRKGPRRKPARANRSQAAAARTKCQPVRGLKLRTVSLGTLIFALACLAAFVAGRPNASAANGGAEPAGLVEWASSGTLRHDDARSLLGSDSRGERKAGTQKIEKGARARTPISFLLADPQQKNKQAKDF
jgi:hypothetical protein